jgi:hypothetical protein
VISLVLVLIVWFVWQFFSKSKKIPLAGLQSSIFAVFLASDWWLFHIGLTSDYWLQQLLIK